MSLDLEAFEVIVPIVRPCAVLLFVVTGVGSGCGFPISFSVTMYVISLFHP